MANLYLFRHAKAAPAAPGMRDFDRPLDVKGMSDAKLMGKRLAASAVNPAAILCSASMRTRQTLEAVLPFMPFAGAIAFSEPLYSADAAGYLEAIREHGHAGSLMVIGHNPSTEELAHQLAATADRPAMRLLMEGFPTGALAQFEFEGGLPHLRPHTGTLSAFLRPKDL